MIDRATPPGIPDAKAPSRLLGSELDERRSETRKACEEYLRGEGSAHGLEAAARREIEAFDRWWDSMPEDAKPF